MPVSHACRRCQLPRSTYPMASCGDLGKLLEASAVGAEARPRPTATSSAILDYAGRERALQFAMRWRRRLRTLLCLTASRLPDEPAGCSRYGDRPIIAAGGGLKCFANGELVDLRQTAVTVISMSESPPNLARTVLTDPVHILAFGLGTGLSPFAPGTVGSLLGVAVGVADARLRARAASLAWRQR